MRIYRTNNVRSRVVVFFNNENLESSRSRSFAQQYLPGGPEVLTGLGSSLVRSGLQPDNALAGPQLFLGPFPFVFLRRPRSQRRTAPFRVFVRLENRTGRDYVPGSGSGGRGKVDKESFKRRSFARAPEIPRNVKRYGIPVEISTRRCNHWWVLVSFNVPINWSKQLTNKKKNVTKTQIFDSPRCNLKCKEMVRYTYALLPRDRYHANFNTR